VVLLAVLASGCGRGRSEASASVDTALVDDSVSLTLEAPASIQAGAAVPFRVVLGNVTDRQVVLYTLGREVTYDIAVSGPDGAEVWRRLGESALQDILAVRTLGPRERIVLETEWSGPRRAGTYTAVASVLTDDTPIRSRSIRFTIE
jgi:hypothetical protein